MTLDRRIVLGGGLALAACDRRADAQIPGGQTPVAIPPLRSAAAFPVGVCVQEEQLGDPSLVPLIASQISQVTPEWEMKMEYIVKDDGSFRFEAPDRIAAFAKANGMRLFGHTLIWYAQVPGAFERLDEKRAKFADAYRNYILAVAGRYRGQAVGWDVVNEAVAEDGNGWRDSLWSKKLGKLRHMVLAFQHAREADPDAVLFLNDYNLENLPKKRATFMKLVEALLKAGAPIGGVGTQTHLAADLAPGEITRALKDLASLGLAVHVSEMDVSLTRSRGVLKDRNKLPAGQSRLYAEAAEAFSSLPAAQRFAFTHWGLRDKDSWLKRENPADAPLLFDDAGRPKAAAAAWIGGLRA
ncbi:endo-1,4-beta-xylanase [Phenylobacterium sp. LH3H17]|uniref:endo-1,4-beta-xylanase n=1 Tax=Phenylobacterium sp. LH3H17 TaxID=2903901 RepID=UPI0020C9B17C|nr:endo-1,4-beta-xylanase [Phenylobacterium sp. LH3H17]UTP40687.1 endo-1,4-beta-xylanase [Phenylobacterium sp. LH3H17]